MERKDLDYLQWLQQNARIYLTGMAILTFLIALSFCLFFSNPWQPQKDSVGFFALKDSDEAVAEQQIPEENKKQTEDNRKTEAHTETQHIEQESVKSQERTIPDGLENVKVIEQNIKNEEITSEDIVQEQKPFAVDIREIEGFGVPNSGSLIYGFGTGYDPIYEDYRYHDHLCYQADGGQVTAATDGIVQQIALDQEDQLIIQYGSCMIIYDGLQSCDVTAGETITKGQILGTAGKYLYVKATQQ